MSIAEVESLDENRTNSSLPLDMVFNEGHVVTIACYSSIFVVSLFGNLCVLKAILFGGRKSRVNFMLLHLAIADMIVTTVMIPVEVGWAVTVEWTAGDPLCRFFAFCRIFGHYLSSFVLVCISIDRYFAVVHPLSLAVAKDRGKTMIIAAWLLAATCSFPQVVIFHVERHPVYTFYRQCVTFGFFPSPHHEVIYNIFCLVMLYLAPLFIIVLFYSVILVTIFRKSKMSKRQTDLRRSTTGNLGRARSRTILMTVSIVVAFVICWTPYVVISLWFCFDASAAKRLDIRLQKALFFFACTNSCANPVVYGIFNFCRSTPPNRVRTWQSMTPPSHRGSKCPNAHLRRCNNEVKCPPDAKLDSHDESEQQLLPTLLNTTQPQGSTVDDVIKMRIMTSENHEIHPSRL